MMVTKTRFLPVLHTIQATVVKLHRIQISLELLDEGYTAPFNKVIFSIQNHVIL